MTNNIYVQIIIIIVFPFICCLFGIKSTYIEGEIKKGIPKFIEAIILIIIMILFFRISNNDKTFYYTGNRTDYYLHIILGYEKINIENLSISEQFETLKYNKLMIDNTSFIVKSIEYENNTSPMFYASHNDYSMGILDNNLNEYNLILIDYLPNIETKDDFNEYISYIIKKYNKKNTILIYRKNYIDCYYNISSRLIGIIDDTIQPIHNAKKINAYISCNSYINSEIYNKVLSNFKNAEFEFHSIDEL